MALLTSSKPRAAVGTICELKTPGEPFLIKRDETSVVCTAEPGEMLDGYKYWFCLFSPCGIIVVDQCWWIFALINDQRLKPLGSLQSLKILSCLIWVQNVHNYFVCVGLFQMHYLEYFLKNYFGLNNVDQSGKNTCSSGTLLLLLLLRKSLFVFSPFFIFRGCAVATWHCLLADYSEQRLITGKTNKFLKFVGNQFKVISFKRNKANKQTN